ncbi:restriction endonuclease, partial [Streptomyces sp. G44]|nr:restriction endonuclease [Streptomyces sp. G44]
HVTPARELLPLPVDLFDHTTNELVACSGSATRTHMLAAFGALIDMRRFFTPTPRRVMLVPSEPRPDLADFCTTYDTTLIWPGAKGQFLRSGP